MLQRRVKQYKEIKGGDLGAGNIREVGSTALAQGPRGGEGTSHVAAQGDPRRRKSNLWVRVNSSWTILRLPWEGWKGLIKYWSLVKPWLRHRYWVWIAWLRRQSLECSESRRASEKREKLSKTLDFFAYFFLTTLPLTSEECLEFSAQSICCISWVHSPG